MTADAITGLNHVSVTAADIERSLAFWNRLLGFRILGRGEVAYPYLDEIIGLGPVRLLWAELEIPGTGGAILEIFEYLVPEGRPQDGRTCDPGNVHLCLECADVDALLSKLHAAGVVSRSPEPVTIPRGNWEGYRTVYVTDPDGVTVELLEPPR
jgi:catechol 2,3-dioxygenase-like lactoylglutathione lyase family enzyme